MKKLLLLVVFLIAGNFLFAGGEQEPPAPPPPLSSPPSLSSVPVAPTPTSLPSPAPTPVKPTENTTVREQQTVPLTLDTVIENSGKRIEEAVPGTKLAVLNFTSSSEKFSDYVIEELTGILVRGRKVTMVDRQNLALIRQEMKLQLSGDVSDESAQKIGKQLGAQFIVSGSLVDLGTYYRFRVKVINVETATIEEQSSFNMRNDTQVAFLLGTTAPASPVTSQPAVPSVSQPQSQPTAPVQTASQNQTQPNTPALSPRISTDRAGLYVNGAYQGNMDLLDSIDWIKLNAKSGGNYTIVLGKDEAVPYIILNFNNLQVSISLKGTGTERRVRYDNNHPSYPMFTVGAGVTFILEDGITLSGLQNNNKSMVRVEGGNFTMNGGSIRDNYGGGVYVGSGASFTMNNGTISGNNSSGVSLQYGTFTMNNGTVSGNSARNGGGVYVDSGTFTMADGTINGNTAENGGGVYVRYGTFTKSGIGGIIYGSNASEEQANRAVRDGHAVYIHSDLVGHNRKRNSTARISQAVDTRQSGAAGGWE